MLSFKRSFSFKFILLMACFVAGQAFAFAAHATQTGGSNPICDQEISQGVSDQLNASTDGVTNFQRQNYTPPAALSQVSNSPCLSKELGRISNQFSYAPSRYSQQLTGGLLSAAGPVSGIMQKLFKSEIDSINSAASSIAGMLDFQGMASDVMGSLLGSLGLGDAFSSELCGLMVDMMLKYIQCEKPINLPSLGNLFGNLNNLIPNNCAGNALRSGLYAAGNTSALKNYNQSVTLPTGNTVNIGMPEILQLAR
jgi:hypothetical protein